MNDRGTFKAKYTTPHGVEFYAELGTIEDASFGNSYYGSGESVRVFAPLSDGHLVRPMTCGSGLANGDVPFRIVGLDGRHPVIFQTLFDSILKES